MLLRSSASAIRSAAAVLALMLLAQGTSPRVAEAQQVQDADGHALTGRIWDVQGKRFIDEGAMLDRLAGKRFVALGEQHDNPEHHRLQAQILQGLIDRGRRPAVAFEMFDDSQADALSAFVESGHTEASQLGDAVGWADSGWPEWRFYQPIADAALGAGLPILTANLNRGLIRTLARDGLDALSSDVRNALNIPAPLPGELTAVHGPAIAEGHCGMLPESMVEPMMRVQTVRDAIMADSMRRGADLPGTDSAVLIAGNGHVRTDGGALWHLVRFGEDAGGTAAVGLLEVSPEIENPEQYGRRHGADAPPFDFVWFTSPVEREDPCQGLRQRFGGTAGGGKAPSAGAE